jgi:hypothetical protein
VSGEKLIVQTGDQESDWPEPVRRAFIHLCLLADEHGFDMICGIGFDLEKAKRGSVHLSAFFSPRASTNPHRTEMCEDIRHLFEQIVKRGTQ